MLGIGLWLNGGGAGFARGGPRIVASSSTLPEGTFGLSGIILSVSGLTGPFTWTITVDADNKFALSGTPAETIELEIDGVLDFETDTLHQFTASADNGVDDPVVQIIAIGVTNVAPTLSDAEGASTAATTADLFFTTTESGIADLVVTTSATVPTDAQIRLGQDHLGAAAEFASLDLVIAAAGIQTVAGTGLPETGGLFLHVIMNDGTADSNIASSVEWTQGAVPILGNQTVEFGRLTAAGAGGYHLVVTGGGAETFAITTDDGTNAGDWTFDADDRLVPTASFVAGPAASYSLGVTATNGIGNSAEATITINTDANAMDVRTIQELTTAVNSTARAFGDIVYARTADYNTEQFADVVGYRIRRTQAPTGTWSAPTLIDAAFPRKGHDLDTANFIKITKRTGADPVIHRIHMNSNAHEDAYIRFTGLKGHRPYLHETPIFGNLDVLTLTGNFVAVDNCEFWGETDTDLARSGFTNSGISMSLSKANGWVQDNHFHDLWDAAVINGSDREVVGNLCERIVRDNFLMAAKQNYLVAWNKILERSTANFGTHHGDGIQFNDGGIGQDITGIEVIGNQMGGTLFPLVAQGIFGDDLSNDWWYVGRVDAGNIVITTAPHGLTSARQQDYVCRNNTIVGAPDQEFGGTIFVTASNRSPDADGLTIRDNVSEGVSFTENIGPEDIGNNVVADKDAVSGPTSFAALFDAPADQGDITDPAVQYAIKASSAADTAVPKAGAHPDYCNHATREDDFPWEEDGFDATNAFTDSTDVAVDTLITAAPVQITGISATGAETYLSGDGSPEFRITSDEAGSTVVRDWGTDRAIIANNQWHWRRATSSALAETARNITVNIGASSDTWTVTTAAEDVTAPALVSVVPNDNATGVALDADIVVTWDETLVNGAGTLTLKKTSDNSTVDSWIVPGDAGAGAGQFEKAAGAATFHPTANRDASTEYYIIWDAGIFEDAAGNGVAAQSSTTAFSFTTTAGVPAFAVLATITDPANVTVTNTYSGGDWDGVSLGTAHAQRVIKALFETAGNGSLVSAASVGGVAGVMVEEHPDTTGYFGLWQFEVPTGATGNIIVTIAGATATCLNCKLWAGYPASPTKVDSGKHTGVTGTTPAVVSDLENVSGGYAIYATVGTTQGAGRTVTTTWGGSDAVVSDLNSAAVGEANIPISAGHILFTESGTTNDLTATPDVSFTKHLIAGSWGASA